LSVAVAVAVLQELVVVALEQEDIVLQHVFH
jgi:hypothetical protein